MSRTFKQFFSTLFRRGFRTAYISHSFRRELTKEEIRQMDDWFKGVDRAFDVLNSEMAKMPKFAEEITDDRP
jgi:hypothetical protein